MNEFAHQKNLDSLLPGVAEQETKDFDRRTLTVTAMGELACKNVEERYGSYVADVYAETSWNYQELRRFSVDERRDPAGTAPQVFHRWHNLTAHQLDLLPVTFEFAKRLNYDLSLLGAAVIGQAFKTPVSRELMTEFHARKLRQLTSTSTSA